MLNNGERSWEHAVDPAPSARPLEDTGHSSAAEMISDAELPPSPCSAGRHGRRYREELHRNRENHYLHYRRIKAPC